MEITINAQIVWSGLSLVALGILTLLFFSYRSVSRSISADVHRRTEIQQQFESFIAANRATKLDHVAINEFLHITSDVTEHFSSPNILNLRHEVFDYAHRLSHVQKKISDSAPGTEVDVALLDARRNLLAWFGKTNKWL